MTDGDLYERFEYIDPPRHRKFYELEVELALFYPKRLIRRWGRIGTRRPRELRCVYPTPEALREAITQIRQRREATRLLLCPDRSAWSRRSTLCSSPSLRSTRRSGSFVVIVPLMQGESR